MLEILVNWYKKKFSDPDTVTLFLLLVTSFFTLYWVGHILVPVLVAIVIAYLLEWPVVRFERMGMSRSGAASSVLLLFTGFLVVSGVIAIPVLWQQASEFVQNAPQMISEGKQYIMALPERYPDYVDTAMIASVLNDVDARAVGWMQQIVEASLSKIVDLVALMIYLILVPLMIFFMLKDKEELMGNFKRLLPEDRRLINQVGIEMNQQIMNYIRGKVIEIVVVGGSTYIALALFDLQYAALLGFFVGLSVLVPYIGAAVVTIPVMLVAVFQFGIEPQFWYVMIAYGVIQALDGNLLVPLLFSEAVDLNPVFIIIAVLFFGGIWGFWGVFFAIPLASLVKAVINAWSESTRKDTMSLDQTA